MRGILICNHINVRVSSVPGEEMLGLILRE